jgi:hypothetical protein
MMTAMSQSTQSGPQVNVNVKSVRRYVEERTAQHAVSKEQISLAHTPAQFGRVASTLVESLNGVLKTEKYRYFPVFKMIQAIHSWKVAKMEQRYSECQSLGETLQKCLLGQLQVGNFVQVNTYWLIFRRGGVSM